MTVNSDKILRVAERLRCYGRERFEGKTPRQKPLPPRIPHGNDFSEEGLHIRREMLEKQGICLDALTGKKPMPSPQELSRNIENFIGFAALPVGVMGPLRINGAYAHGDFYVPLATSEGALVASCNRGAYVISQSGGARAVCLTESVSRAPSFSFATLTDSLLFVDWVIQQQDRFQELVNTTSSHCKFLDFGTSVLGSEVFLIFNYETGEAAGQNMVTLATDAICQWLVVNASVKPERWYLEGNLSGDKKATMISFASNRGKKVVAEVEISAKLLRRFLHVDASQMLHYWETSLMGALQSGSIGAQGHYSNALAAIFIACGQDAACVSEASVGITRMDHGQDGGLYVSVSLPNLIVGTVGGGTRLPTANESLRMLGCQGEDSARRFAEICAVTAMAGEISIIAALASGEFASAHAAYGRQKK